MVDFTTNDFVPPDHSDPSWQKLSPMIFFAQLPNTVYGEQLFAQIITAIASRIWLFRHGRIQLGFICGESLLNDALLKRETGSHEANLVPRSSVSPTSKCIVMHTSLLHIRTTSSHPV